MWKRMWNGLWRRVKEEPVAFQSIIQTVLALAISFGLKLSGNTVGSILAVTAAILGFATRSVVTPTSNPKADDGTPLIPRSTGAMGPKLSGAA